MFEIAETGARYWRAQDVIDAEMDVPTNLPHNTWTPGAARGFCTLDPSLRLTSGNDQKETLKERWKRGAKHSMRVALSSKMLGGLADRYIVQINSAITV